MPFRLFSSQTTSTPEHGNIPADLNPVTLARAPGPTTQPRLKAEASNDRFEREADSVADQVMQMPDTRSGPLSPLRGSTSAVPALRGSGQPLSEASRRYFESRFGHDFGQVRVHTDRRAAALADSLDAKAFTLGRHMVFGDGHYQPDSKAGRRLLAHELAHTVQQGGAAETCGMTSVGGDSIQKDDDDKKKRNKSGSNWRFQIGFGPMRAPSPSGPAADHFPATPQLPIPGFMLNRGLGLQYSQGQLDVGVFPNLGAAPISTARAIYPGC